MPCVSDAVSTRPPTCSCPRDPRLGRADGTWMFQPHEQGSAEIIEVARLRGVGVGGAAAGVERSSRCCRCSSSTRWLTFSCSSSSSSPGFARAVHRQSAAHFSCAQRGTDSANCAEDCTWSRRPCDQQRQVPTVQRFEPSCPRFSSSSEWRTFLL